jgi:hypothetical protein
MGWPGAVLADITWHNCFRFLGICFRFLGICFRFLGICFRFLGIDPPKLFSFCEQRIPGAGRVRPVRAVDLPRRRGAAAAAAPADPAR